MIRLDWNNAEEISPCNGEKCIVKDKDGGIALAQQNYGEWQDLIDPDIYYDSIVEWIYLDYVQTMLNTLQRMIKKNGGKHGNKH